MIVQGGRDSCIVTLSKYVLGDEANVGHLVQDQKSQNLFIMSLNQNNTVFSQIDLTFAGHNISVSVSVVEVLFSLSWRS